ncbi:alpha/beta-hydrolase [Trametes polyzona]|nr:alpha/beta-hydrolase [Trametes polyzona]
MSYSRPPVPSAADPEELVPLQSLLPIDAPNRCPTPPQVQLPPEEVVSGYIRTSHVVPAACPRYLPSQSGLRHAMCDDVPSDMEAALGSLAAARRAFEIQKTRAPQRLLSYEQQWNCVDRYVHPRTLASNAARGVTLFLVHSGGFSRQIWEPMLRPLLQRLSESATDIIDEIWSFEAVQHGDSAVINDHAQRDIVDWHDLTRDILNFLSTYLPNEPGAFIDTVLQPVSPCSESKAPRRKVVGIGHSFGGTILARAAIDRPYLFESLVLVEPIIFSAAFQDRGPGPGRGMLEFLFTSTLAKQPAFASEDEARAYFKMYPTSARWDPRILEVVMQHGLIADHEHEQETNGDALESAEGRVRLKTRPFDETVVTYGWRSAHEVWSALPNIEPRLSLHWIMSGKSAAWTGGRAMTRRTVWRRPTNASNVLIPGAGHSILQEKPDELAGEVFAFLFSKYGHLDAIRLHSGIARLQGLLPWVYTMHKL